MTTTNFQCLLDCICSLKSRSTGSVRLQPTVSHRVKVLHSRIRSSSTITTVSVRTHLFDLLLLLLSPLLLREDPEFLSGLSEAREVVFANRRSLALTP